MGLMHFLRSIMDSVQCCGWCGPLKRDVQSRYGGDRVASRLTHRIGSCMLPGSTQCSIAFPGWIRVPGSLLTGQHWQSLVVTSIYITV